MWLGNGIGAVPDGTIISMKNGKGGGRLLKIIRKEIDLDASEVLFDEPFTPQNLAANWTLRSPDWRVEDGWLMGKNPENRPGMVVSRADYPGNILMDFEARTVPPCSHDIDFMWNGSWDEDRNVRGTAYVAGLEGWWEGKVGIEKSPEYKFTVATPLLDFKPGRTYHVQGGSIDGHCFVFVDGKLVIEATDPDPIDPARFAKVGFEAYCSHIAVRNLVVRRIAWRPVDSNYVPEFK